MLKTLEWDLKQDKDGDGIPDLEGQADTSFDATPIKGKDCYTASVYLGALIALREAARTLGIPKDEEWFNELLGKAKRSFEELFNGKYFDAWVGNPDPKGFVFM